MQYEFRFKIWDSQTPFTLQILAINLITAMRTYLREVFHWCDVM